MAGLSQRKQQYNEHHDVRNNGKFIPVLLILLFLSLRSSQVLAQD